MTLAAARKAGLSPYAETEIGQIIDGSAEGRTDNRQVTICDLTGTGAQDTAIASHVSALLNGTATGTVITA